MSEYAPGSWQFAERIMDMNVEKAHLQAARHRLWRQAQGDRRTSRRFYFGALAWLGYRLAAWGQRLQARYSSEGSTPMPQSI
jgi:hypothetical protein